MQYFLYLAGRSAMAVWRKQSAKASQGLAVFLTALLALVPAAKAAELTEYQLKAAFLFNFVVFTEWPLDVGSPLTLCIYGQDSFGDELNSLQGKVVGNRTLNIQRKSVGDSLKSCQIVFISDKSFRSLPRVLDEVRDRPVLTVAESAGAARQGVALNMAVVDNKITFEASQLAARSARLNLSSKLLRLATEVYQ